MRALVYTRVSDDRANGRSVAEQEIEARAVCDREGWEVAEVVTDSVGASRRSKGTRDGWERARQLVGAGDIDVLVTWEASRAQRDLAAYSELRDLCASTGTLWSYSGRTHDLADAHDRFTTGLDALIAEREAEETSSRVLRAMRANAAEGRPHGRRLFGYRRLYDERTGRLVSQEPHPDEAPTVRRVFAAYLSGVGMRTIAKDLDAEGLRTPAGARWTDVQIGRLLRRPSYAARRVHHGEVIGPADWPALVDPDVFDRVQARLAERAGPTTGQSPRIRLLAGVGRCGTCGSRLLGNRTSSGRRTYQCRAAFCVTRGQVEVDAHVTARILERLEHPDTASSLTAAPSPVVAESRARIDELRAKIAEATDEFVAGRLSAGTLASIEGRLLAEVTDCERAIRRAAIPLEIDLPADGDYAGWWKALGAERQREVAAALVESVTIMRTVRGTRRFDPGAVVVRWRG